MTDEQQLLSIVVLAAPFLQSLDKKASVASTKESHQMFGDPEVRGVSTSCCK